MARQLRTPQECCTVGHPLLRPAGMPLERDRVVIALPCCGPIARGQLEWEDAARARAPHLLILDTHLLSNILWSRTLFGDCPAWLEPALLQRHYDLHLLLSPEGIDWQADGQRCQPALADRQRFHRDCRAWLQRHARPWVAIGGDWAQREAQAIAQVARLLD